MACIAPHPVAGSAVFLEICNQFYPFLCRFRSRTITASQTPKNPWSKFTSTMQRTQWLLVGILPTITSIWGISTHHSPCELSTQKKKTRSCCGESRSTSRRSKKLPLGRGALAFGFLTNVLGILDNVLGILGSFGVSGKDFRAPLMLLCLFVGGIAFWILAKYW